MAEWLNCLLYKHRHLISDPSTHITKLGIAADFRSQPPHYRAGHRHLISDPSPHIIELDRAACSCYPRTGKVEPSGS